MKHGAKLKNDQYHGYFNHNSVMTCDQREKNIQLLTEPTDLLKQNRTKTINNHNASCTIIKSIN